MRLALVAVLLCLANAASAAELTIRVTISTQAMEVRRAGDLLYEWPVSTARAGKCTPTGVFQPEWLARYHRSSLYDNAPMPWSIFFHGNYAIHGTTAVDRLGEPASAGCIRLAPENAERLFALVLEVGTDDTEIVIEQTPSSPETEKTP